jgi:hypothetical protein
VLSTWLFKITKRPEGTTMADDHLPATNEISPWDRKNTNQIANFSVIQFAENVPGEHLVGRKTTSQI